LAVIFAMSETDPRESGPTMSEDPPELHADSVSAPSGAAAEPVGAAAWVWLALQWVGRAFAVEFGLLFVADRVFGLGQVVTLPVLFLGSVAIAIIGVTVVVLSHQSRIRKVRYVAIFVGLVLPSAIALLFPVNPR